MSDPDREALRGFAARIAERLDPGLVVNMRSAEVLEVNDDGTIDVDLAGTTIEDVEALSSSDFDAGDRAILLCQAGDMLALGSPKTEVFTESENPFTPALRGTGTDPDTGSNLTGFWRGMGRYVHVEFSITFGTDSDPGSGDYLIVVPFQPAAPVGTAVGQVHLVDATDDADPDRHRSWQVVVASNSEPLLAIRGTGSTTSPLVGATTPWTWDDGDTLMGTAWYRVGEPVPDTLPYLDNILTGSDGSETTSRSISLAAGEADKFIVWMSGNSAWTEPPTGWTDIGWTAAGLRVAVRAATTDTSVTLTTESDRGVWITGHIINGDLSGLVSSSAAFSSDTPNPAGVSGSLTNWVGIGVYGSQQAFAVPPTVDAWPSDLPASRIVSRIASAGQPAVVIASGPFVGVTTVNPSAFTLSTSAVGAVGTIAIPASS